MVAGLSEEQVEKIGQALAAGRSIEAIRIYRLATGKGLKKSKDYIDVLVAELKERNPDKYPAARGRSSAALMFMAFVIQAASLL